MKKALLTVYCCLAFVLNTDAQIYEWLKGGYNAIYTDICAENKGTSVSLFYHANFGATTRTDTTNFDTFQFIQTLKPSTYNSFVVRHDSSGKVIMVKMIKGITGSTMCRDDSGNFYIGAFLAHADSALLGSGYVVKKSKGGVVVFKLDKQFNYQWVIQMGNDTSRIKEITYSNGHIFFIANSRGKTRIGDTTYNFKINDPSRPPFFTDVYGELEAGNGSVKWSNFLWNNADQEMFGVNHITSLKNRLYLSGGASTIPNTIIIKGDTINTGIIIFMTDSAGNYLKNYWTPNRSSNGGPIINDGENLYFTGTFKDSIKWGNKFHKSSYPVGSFKYNFFVASLTADLKPGWFFSPKIFNSMTPIDGSGFLSNAVYTNKFLYFSGSITDRIIIDSNVLTPSYSGDLIIFKTDLIGNVMWANQGGGAGSFGTAWAMDAIAGKSVYMAGLFGPKLTLGKHVLNGNGAFVTRLSDNAIIRGYVKNGPYCAGDSILIPYQKIGDYDSTNEFIAELSDENGSFNGGQRQLGRLKSNLDGTIIGKAPSLHFNSSDKYRIRILSTKPAVQSYFKVDTLRLLIYSRDKADPGNDTTICQGDTVQLKTFGGTKWTWSNKYNMKDSNARQTVAWPSKTTTYKIIISDSSGCGEADTAYKTVFVKKELRVTFLTPKDTTICKNGSIRFEVEFTGGDSCGYSWQWVSIDANGTYTSLGEGKDQQKDSLFYTMPTGADSMQIVVFLNDSCTPKIGLSMFNLKISNTKAIATFPGKDTTLCLGKTSGIIARFSKGHVPGYNWVWQEKTITNQWVQRKTGAGKQADTFNYILPTSWKGTKQLRVILKDNCSNLSDTAIYNITAKDTLNVILNTKDTSLCAGQKHTWKVTGKGGDKSAYSFTWTESSTGAVLSVTDSLSLIAGSSMTVKLSLTDNCMPGIFSTSFKINVNDPLKSGMLNGIGIQKDTTLCYGSKLSLQADASGGRGSGYLYEWLLDGISISNNDSILVDLKSQFPASGGTKSLLLVLKDNSTPKNDSTSIRISMMPKLEVKVSGEDSICYARQSVFKASGTGGKGGYTSKWLDESGLLLSNADSLKVLHNDASKAGPLKRYAVVSDGCSKEDTVVVNSVLLTPLSISLNSSDTCPVASALLTATISGGKPSAYKVSWWKGNTPLTGNGTTITVSPGIVPVIYKALPDDGCSTTPDTASIVIALKPKLKISVNGLCLGDSSTLKVSGTLTAKYNWTVDGNQLARLDSIIRILFGNTGTHKIHVSSSGLKCSADDSLNISIIEKPHADFDYMNAFGSGQGLAFKFINTSANSNSWNWRFESSNSNLKDPEYGFSKTGIFKVILIASNQNTCHDTIEKEVPVLERITFFFPNAFSPDNNNINDGFGLNLSQHDLVKAYHIEIYNRWGEKVFESDDVSKLWNSDKYQQGVYFYKASIRDIYGVIHEDIEGMVEVLR